MFICYHCSGGEDEDIAAAETLRIRIGQFGIPVGAEVNGEPVSMLQEDGPAQGDENGPAGGITVLITRKMLTDVIALVELDRLRKEWHRGQTMVYTVLYHLTPDALPERLAWLQNTPLVTVETVLDLKTAAVSVACGYWKQRAEAHCAVQTKDVLSEASIAMQKMGGQAKRYLLALQKDYEDLEPADLRARLLVLVVLGQYLSVHGGAFQRHQACVGALFEQISCCGPVTPQEIEMAQYCIRDLCGCIRQSCL